MYYRASNVDYFNLGDKLYELLSLDKFGSLKRLRLESCFCTCPRGFRVFNMLTDLSLYQVDINGSELSDLVSNGHFLIP